MRWMVVSTLQQAGVFEQVWPKADGSGVVVLASAPSEDGLREYLDAMPTVAAGLGGYELVALAEDGGHQGVVQ